MFKVKKLVWVMGSVFVVGGCALPQSRDKQAVSIKPLMDVKHAGGADAMYWLGRYLQSRADYSGAIEAYEKALTENPSNAETHNGLGVCYTLQERHELAWQHLQKAIELSPAAAHLHNNLGYAYLLGGRESEAAAALEQALRLDAGNRQARKNLASVYEKMGLLDKAAILSIDRPNVSPARVAMEATEPLHALYGMAFRQTEGKHAQGRPSTSIPVSLTAPKSDGKVLHEHGPLLVQVTPDVFELRMNEGDLTTTDRTGKTASESRAPNPFASASTSTGGIEVSNGNGTPGTARKVSEFLQRNGFAKARLTNSQPFQQVQTEVQYQPGSYVFADQINKLMPKQAQMVESHSLRHDIQVRVVLGKDLAR